MSLIDGVAGVCRRLEGHGWRGLLRSVSGGGLDIGGSDLAAQLAKPLERIDRSIAGFEDFAASGHRGIEPGRPARSLLYHALASPAVVQDERGRDLTAFPTPAEIEAVENYVYGVRPPTLRRLRARAGGAPLAIAVFAVEYRPGGQTVQRRHADCCFSRTGMARMGTTGPRYDARRREFLPLDDADPHAFLAIPSRFAAFVAAQLKGDPDSFGPMRARPRDRDRRFWVPLHKLFDGPECIAGMTLEVDLAGGHVNEKLRRFHKLLNDQGFDTGWREPEINEYPFVITGDAIAAFSTDPEHGTGLLVPAPHPLAEPAFYKDEPLGFDSSNAYSREPSHRYYTSIQVPPVDEPSESASDGDDGPSVPEYLDGIDARGARRAPEYINARWRMRRDGGEDNLNDDRNVSELVRNGGYRARHFIDFAGDGWVQASVPQLAAELPRRVPAYSIVSPPTFFPYVEQRELMEWWHNEVPSEIRDGIWAIPPRALSDRRLAANVRLPIGFSIDDNTVTAIVSQPHEGSVELAPASPGVLRPSTLPDGTAGLFDPGWDVTQDRTADNRFYLEAYGLGTPFIEDAKLCAALGTYWPGVSPDATRTFQPDKRPQCDDAPWPTVSPLTDEELGIAQAPGGGYLPWDGVRGPEVVEQDGRRLARYPDMDHTDYLETADRFTAALTAKVDYPEYAARVLAMADVYWALGIDNAEYFRKYKPRAKALDELQFAKSQWAVLSFRAVADGGDEELREAEAATGITLYGPHRYRFHVYRWGPSETDPDDFRKVLVEMHDEVSLYVDLLNVLVRREGATWTAQRSPIRG
jgi:hypothetical protein